MAKTYTIIVKKNDYVERVRSGVDELNKCVIIGDMNIDLQEQIEKGELTIESFQEHCVDMNIKKLQEIIKEPASIAFLKDEHIVRCPLQEVTDEVLPVFYLRVQKKYYSGRCYIDRTDQTFYFEEMSAPEKKFLRIQEELTYWCFGSYIKPIDVPDNLKEFGFTKAVEERYECDSGD